MDFFGTCIVIMTGKPKYWDEYKQIVGRSNRLNFKGEKNAVLFTDEATTQGALETSLEVKSYDE